MHSFFRKLGKRAYGIAQRGGGARVVGKNRFGDATIKADIEIERMVSKELSRVDCSFIGEETAGWWRDDAEFLFVLDPLDGSENYRNGFPSYSFAICGGRLKKGTFSDIEEALVLDLANGDEYYARKGGGVFVNGRKIRRKKPGRRLICADLGNLKAGAEVFSFLSKRGYMRMLGASTLEMCLAACGRLEAFLHLGNSMRAVHAAGCFMMKEAGMNLANRSGGELCFGVGENGFDVIATWDAGLQEEIIEFLSSTNLG